MFTVSSVLSGPLACFEDKEVFESSSLSSFHWPLLFLESFSIHSILPNPYLKRMNSLYNPQMSNSVSEFESEHRNLVRKAVFMLCMLDLIDVNSVVDFLSALTPSGDHENG